MPFFTLTVPFHALHCHPACVYPEGLAIEASATRTAQGDIDFEFRVTGPVDTLDIPAPNAPAAADNLWQHTCCEAFVGIPGEDAYHEFNFSPSGQWASYRFNGYRQRDTAFAPATRPQLAFSRRPAALHLSARLPSAQLPQGNTFDIALSAVIEAGDGSKSYWALVHPAAQPDFHLRQNFVLTLPAQEK